MENFEQLLGGMQLHPVADHYTVALLTVAVIIDLVASLFPMRTWLRNAALTLMIVGALAAAASYWTGDMEADRIWDMMSPEAHQYFKGNIHFLGHGALGYELMFVFAGLAVWRLLTAMFSFMQESRGLYLLTAVIGVGFLFYQGHTGGELVYRYGVGTGPMASGATPAPTPAPEATPIPTVYVPPGTPAPEIPTAAASPGSAAPASKAPAAASGSAGSSALRAPAASSASASGALRAPAESPSFGGGATMPPAGSSGSAAGAARPPAESSGSAAEELTPPGSGDLFNSHPAPAGQTTPESAF